MEFCTITPIAGLERWGTALSKRHLVLAHMLYNKEYLKYYVDRRAAGDFIILDNGAYENTKPVDSEAYVNFIKTLDPQVAVLPDILMSPWQQTTSASLLFLDRFAERLRERNYKTEWMFVPQTTETEITKFNNGLFAVLTDSRVGYFVKWIGLGRYLATKFGDPLLRVSIAKDIIRNFPDHHIHALGMAAGSLEELKALHFCGVESIDSSAPVWRGWNGYSMNTPKEMWDQYGSACEFSAEGPKHVDIIDANLEVIKNVLV